MKKFLLNVIFIGGILLHSNTLLATTYYVSTSGTTANNGLSASTPTTLANAINSKAKTSGDVVIIAAGTYTPTAQLTPSAGVSITGAGSGSTIIDCSSYSTSTWTTDISLFKITKSNVSVSGITIQNCYKSDIWNTSTGGAICIKGTSALTGITLSDLVLKNNRAQQGAGIYAEKATFSIANSTFTGNTFSSGGSGNGGALYLNNCTTTLSNSDIANNYALVGAGIYVSGGSLTVTNTTIESNGHDAGNNSSYNGGGIYATSATVSISNSKIRNNISYNGGAIYSSEGILTITNTNIYDNSVAPSTTGQGYGGGLSLSCNTTTLTNCNLANNIAGLKGGAMYIGGGTTNIISCTISYNEKNINWSAATAGIDLTGNSSCGSAILNLTNSILSGNVNVQETWSTGDANLSTDVSSSTVTVTNSVVGTTYYDQSETPTTNAFDPTTDLGGVDSDGNITIKKAKKCTWSTTTTSTDWNKASNWVEGCVPYWCSNVIIPSNAAAYPILSATTHAACDTIYFKAGAEIGHPQYLSYQSAKVDLELLRARWYLVNAPFKNVYSGDYTFSGLKPLTYIRDWSVAISTNQTSVYWSTAISDLDVNFNLGKNFILYLTGTDLLATSKTITFPSTASNYQYYYTSNLLKPVASGTYTGTLSRNKSDRFIYEDSNDKAPASSFTETLTSDGDVGDYYVVGNPFMSHLDFSKFYSQNVGVISKEVKLWNSATKQFVTYANDSLGYASIPPMQSFIVKLKKSGTATVTFTYDMSVTNPSCSAKLKSTSAEANTLHIKASRNTDVSNIALAFKDADSIAADTEYVASTERLFSGMVQTTPTLYAHVGDKYLDYYTASDTTTIPLGIKTTSSGSTTLSFAGIENFDACQDILFKDSVAGVTMSLLDNDSYTFTNPGGNVSGRFSIQFIPTKSATVTGCSTTSLESDNNSGISIWGTTNKIKISSKDASLSSVSIYDLQGRLVISNNSINNKTIEISINGSNSYIVKATDNAGNTKTEKIIVP